MIMLLRMALIPPILLMIYIYKLDSIEKEPIGLLAKLFFLGVLSTIPAIILEQIGGGILNSLVPYGNLYLLLENFIVVACAEEGCKYFMLKIGSWKHTAFDYIFDGVVYGAITSLGFAAAENVLYLFNFGIGIGPARAFTAIPLHCIAGIFMGHYYGMAKAAENDGDLQMSKQYRRNSLIVPILIHGFYDFCASSSITVIGILFFVFIIGLDIVAFRRVRRYAREDQRI